MQTLNTHGIGMKHGECSANVKKILEEKFLKNSCV